MDEPDNKLDRWDVQFENCEIGTTVKLNGKHIPGLRNVQIEHKCGEGIVLHLDIAIRPNCEVLKVKCYNPGDAA